MTAGEGLLKVTGILDQIVRARRVRVEEAKRLRSIEDLRERASLRHPLSLAAALSRTDRTNIIAEVKYRSPSKGIIREDFDPVAIAEEYSRAGAAALSILTEEDFFGGSLDYLRDIRKRIGLPLLRKDFIFDTYQVFEAVEAGADAILLITAILDDELLWRLIAVSGELGLDALVEVHTKQELLRATRAGARILGVNNRDLTTFKVELETSVGLCGLASSETILVSESGIRTQEDIKRLQAAGFQGFLVGEHLMRAPRPGEALAELIAEADKDAKSAG